MILSEYKAKIMQEEYWITRQELIKIYSLHHFDQINGTNNLKKAYKKAVMYVSRWKEKEYHKTRTTFIKNTFQILK